MTTLREKRHRQCLNTIGRLTEQREVTFRRLAIIQNKLHFERTRLRRLQKELGKQPMPAFTPLPTPPAWLEDKVLEHGPPLSTLYRDSEQIIPDPIPDFLKRDKADAKARAEIAAEKEAKAKAKRDKKGVVAPGRKLGPDAQRMPVTGRDALKVLKRLRGG